MSHVVYISLSPAPNTAATSWSGSKWLASLSWGSPCDSWFPNIVLWVVKLSLHSTKHKIAKSIHQNKLHSRPRALSSFWGVLVPVLSSVLPAQPNGIVGDQPICKELLQIRYCWPALPVNIVTGYLLCSTIDYSSRQLFPYLSPVKSSCVHFSFTKCASPKQNSCHAAPRRHFSKVEPHDRNSQERLPSSVEKWFQNFS